MESILNQQQPTSFHGVIPDKGETLEEKVALLEQKIAELKMVCDEMNPYLPISDEHKAILEKNYITELFDPFAITNKLLILLEDSIEELHKLKNIPLN